MFAKKLSKYIHVGSCFEEFIVRNTMVQLDFNYDIWFRCYDFFWRKMLFSGRMTSLFRMGQGEARE
jgi:hypothetical protein